MADCREFEVAGNLIGVAFGSNNQFDGSDILPILGLLPCEQVVFPQSFGSPSISFSNLL